jgi:hypothetical protein
MSNAPATCAVGGDALAEIIAAGAVGGDELAAMIGARLDVLKTRGVWKNIESKIEWYTLNLKMAELNEDYLTTSLITTYKGSLGSLQREKKARDAKTKVFNERDARIKKRKTAATDPALAPVHAPASALVAAPKETAAARVAEEEEEDSENAEKDGKKSKKAMS